MLFCELNQDYLVFAVHGLNSYIEDAVNLLLKDIEGKNASMGEILLSNLIFLKCFNSFSFQHCYFHSVFYTLKLFSTSHPFFTSSVVNSSNFHVRIYDLIVKRIFFFKTMIMQF